MAFNPFHAFRKHKKVTFAALTIVCMFVFVLQAGFSGGADPLDRLAALLGTRRMKEGDVGQLNGRPITPQDLQGVRVERELASTYMKRVADQVVDSFKSKAAASFGKDSKLSLDDAGGHGIYMRNAQILDAYVRPFGRNPMERQAYFEPEVDFQPFSPQKLIDFMVWKEVAKKLGIELTDEAVEAEVNRLMLGGLPTKDMQRRIADPIAAALQRDQRFRGASLKSALRDELNVRLAKAAILGEVYPNMAVARVPVAVTPNEFWDFFKEQRTELEVAFLPVRVEDYLTQVTAQPTEAELKKLFERYKDNDYNPDSREPGFRQPRRVQAQFVGGDPNSAIYAQKGKELGILHEAMVRINGGMPVGPFGGVVPTSVSVALPLAVDLPMAAKFYQELYRLNEMGDRPLRAPYWTNIGSSPLRNAVFFQPATIAGVLGQALAPPAISTWPTWLGLGMAAERQFRADLAVSLIFSRSPFAAAAILVKEGPRETNLPFDAVKDWVAARLQDQLARDALIGNLNGIRKEIEEYKKAKKLPELDKFLASQAEKLNLVTGKSGLHDLHKDPIGDDPGLRALRQAYLRRPGDPLGKFFGHVFFTQARPYDVETWPRGFGDPSDPDRDPWRNAPQLFLLWKTEDQASKAVALTDPAVRKEVERAWRWQKARELAKQAADKFAKEATALKGDLPKLRDFALRHTEELILKDDRDNQGFRLAKQIKIEEARPEFPLRYRQPSLPDDKIPSIGTPGFPEFGVPGDASYRRFMDKVLDLKDKPQGTAVSAVNKPESVYYIAILTKQQPPSQEEFMRAYKEATATGERRGDLFRHFMQQQGSKFYEPFLEALRKEMKLEVNEERIQAMESRRDEG